MEIKTLTLTNILKFGKVFLFLGFIIYCAITFQFTEILILNYVLGFLYVSGLILTVIGINYFSETISLDKDGIIQKRIFSKLEVKWEEIKSLDVQIITADKYVDTLEKSKYFENFPIGRKEILVSTLENQLKRSNKEIRKNVIRLPFNDEILSLIKQHTILL